MTWTDEARARLESGLDARAIAERTNDDTRAHDAWNRWRHWRDNVVEEDLRRALDRIEDLEAVLGRYAQPDTYYDDGGTRARMVLGMK